MNSVNREYKIPWSVSDEDFKFLHEHNTDFKRMNKKCPTCRGTGTYMLDGQRHDCDIDENGRDYQLRLFKLYCLSNLPMQYMNVSWDDYPHADTAEKMDLFIDNFEHSRVHGVGIEIYGSQMGSGKSWAATYILRELVKMGYPGWYVEFSEMRSIWDLYEGWEKRYRTDRMLRAEILVIDEILRPSTQRQRGFFEDQLEWVVRHRTNHNLPTITTTNLVPEELTEYFPRLHSLLSAKQSRHEICGEDFRINGAFVRNNALALSGESVPLT